MDLRAVRTMLFTPANKSDRFEKAKQAGADGLIIDLEDAISFTDKDSARKTAVDYLLTRKPDVNFIVALRVNSIKTSIGLEDLIALIHSRIRPDILVLPKVESAEEIIIYDSLMCSLSVPYIALIETARGLQNVNNIANASKNVKALAFGGGDLAADLGAELKWEPMLTARFLVLQAAASAGIAAMDVPYLNLKDHDENGVIEETKKIKDLGYTGKLAIHPRHVKPIIMAFMPSAEEVNRAQNVVKIYEAAGGGVCEIEGKMIDVPIYRSAKRIVDLTSILSQDNNHV